MAEVRAGYPWEKEPHSEVARLVGTRAGLSRRLEQRSPVVSTPCPPSGHTVALSLGSAALSIVPPSPLAI